MYLYISLWGLITLDLAGGHDRRRSSYSGACEEAGARVGGGRVALLHARAHVNDPPYVTEGCHDASPSVGRSPALGTGPGVCASTNLLGKQRH